MGLYLQIDDADELPLASNVGWGDVCRWAKALPGGTGNSGEADCVKHLCAFGWEQEVGKLTEELQAAMKAYPPKHDTLSTLKNMAKMLGGSEKAVLVTVTDGLSSDKDDDDDDSDTTPKNGTGKHLLAAR